MVEKKAEQKYKEAAKKSIELNPEIFKPKTMDAVLHKISNLEAETSFIKKTVSDLYNHVMPNETMRWPGMYNAIKELTDNISKLEKMQESHIYKAEKRDEKIRELDLGLVGCKQQIQDIEQKMLIKETKEKAIKAEEKKQSQAIVYGVKIISGVGALISIATASITIYQMLK